MFIIQKYSPSQSFESGGQPHSFPSLLYPNSRLYPSLSITPSPPSLCPLSPSANPSPPGMGCSLPGHVRRGLPPPLPYPSPFSTSSFLLSILHHPPSPVPPLPLYALHVSPPSPCVRLWHESVCRLGPVLPTCSPCPFTHMKLATFLVTRQC